VLAKLHRDNRRTPPVVVVSGMRLGPIDRQRLVKAAAIVPKSEISKGTLRSVVANLAHDQIGASM